MKKHSHKDYDNLEFLYEDKDNTPVYKCKVCGTIVIDEKEGAKSV